MKHRIKFQSLILPILIGTVVGVSSRNISVGTAVFVVLLIPACLGTYIPYAKDNPNKLWFRRKLYGWGWTPVTWQGWLLTAGYVGLIVLSARSMDHDASSQAVALTFTLPFVLLTLIFLLIAYKKGEKPRWQWGTDGKPKND